MRSAARSVISDALLTPAVRAHVADLAAQGIGVQDAAHLDYVQWRSWPQQFPSTNAPWNGIGGQAITTKQVTVGTDPLRDVYVVFVEHDLYAIGTSRDHWLWEQVHSSSNLNFAKLDKYGLHVLDRPLPREAL